jgi:hypothetical protein
MTSWLISLILLLCFYDIFCETTEKKGAIVVLTKGKADLRKYKGLIHRNVAVEKYAYTQDLTDVIIFHEGNVFPLHQQYIAKKTPRMPLVFVNVSAVFQKYRPLNNTFCPNPNDSSDFSAGYRSKRSRPPLLIHTPFSEAPLYLLYPTYPDVKL